MISEEQLVRFLDMNPFSVRKIYRRHDLTMLIKTVLVVWQVIGVYKTIALSIEINVFDVETFVKKFSYICIAVYTLIGIYLVLSSSRVRWFILEDLNDFNSSLDLPTSTNSGVIIPVIFFCLVGHISAFTFLARTAFIVNFFVYASTNYTVTAIKHLASKSLKALIDKMVKSESPIEVVHNFRQVLSYDRKSEDIFSFIILTGLSNGVFIIFLSLVAYWKAYGLHQICNCFESNHPFVSIVSEYYAMCQLLLLGIVSTNQQGFVSNVKIFCRIRQHLGSKF